MNAIIRNIPNALTCLNLLAGFTAIALSSQGDEPLWGLKGFQWGFIFIAIAVVADFFDGFSARKLHAYSALGKELDSLSDLVSFGVAPAALLFAALSFNGAPEWLPWFAAVIPVCGAIRLARFNIDSRQSTSFVGLPIPANAIFWIGFINFYYALPTVNPWLTLLCIIVLSLLMVSNLRMFSLKFKTYGWRGNAPRYIIMAAAVVFLFCMGISGLMWLIVFYVCFAAAIGTRFDNTSAK